MSELTKEEFYAKMIEHINYDGEFAVYNNIRMTKVSENYAEGELTVKPESLNYMGVVHGGCLATLADTTAGVAYSSSGNACVTVNYGLNFLRPAKGKKIICKATPEKVGRTISVFKIALTDDNGKLVATGDFTFFNMGKIELDK